MWALIKLGLGFFKTYKYIAITIALVGVLATAYAHIRKDGIRDTQLVVYEQSTNVQSQKIIGLNARITEQNEAKLEALAESEAKLKASQVVAAEIRAKNEVMETEMGVLRFEILEAIRDDEDYADWAFGTVHPDAWLMLQHAVDPGVGD